jgi:hypothetical protein
VAKSKLLLAILKDMQEAGILEHLVLIGSWCQDIYRHIYNNPVEIPATRTTDADFLVPRRLPESATADIPGILHRHDFVLHESYKAELSKYTHPELDVEFLTQAGSKANEGVHRFPQLGGIGAEELRYMNIPLAHRINVSYMGIGVNIPEPEAYALHKLIVARLRKDPEKEAKDMEAAAGMLRFFGGKHDHLARLNDLYASFSKGWRKKVDIGLRAIQMALPAP